MPRRGVPRIALVLFAVATTFATLGSTLFATERVPAQDAGVAASPPPIAGVAEKMGRRVLSELRQIQHAMPRVVASVHTTQPDGAEDIVLLYEYTDYDACVGSAPTKAQGRVDCRDRLSALCTHRELAHVTIAATPRGRPAGTGGALAIAARREEAGACLLDHVVQLDRRDVDGDARPEIVVDLVGVDHPSDFRSGVSMDVYSRTLSVLREDLTPQFTARLSGWGQDNALTDTAASAARWSLTPAHALRIESFDYTSYGSCGEDRDGWFQPISPDDDDGSGCAGTIAVTTHAYDSATDSFP